MTIILRQLLNIFLYLHLNIKNDEKNNIVRLRFAWTDKLRY